MTTNLPSETILLGPDTERLVCSGDVIEAGHIVAMDYPASPDNAYYAHRSGVVSWDSETRRLTISD